MYTSPFIFLSVKTEKNTKGQYIVSDYATFSVKSIGYEGNRISSLSIVDDKSGSVVYTFPRGGKQTHDEPKERPHDSEAVKAEADKMRELILKLASSAGRDESTTRMFAEGYIERKISEFIPFDEMSVGHLASVKVELAKRIDAEKSK